MRFETAKDGWTLVIDAQSDADITEIDLGELDEPTLVAQMTEIANAPMSLLGKPLVEMTVARCGSKGDAVIWRVNHIIADGYSMELLMQELWAFLLGYPIQQPALSFPDYLKHFTRAPRAKAAEFDAFWENKFANPPPAPKIGRMAKGLPPNLLNRGGR